MEKISYLCSRNQITEDKMPDIVFVIISVLLLIWMLGSEWKPEHLYSWIIFGIFTCIFTPLISVPVTWLFIQVMHIRPSEGDGMPF